MRNEYNWDQVIPLEQCEHKLMAWSLEPADAMQRKTSHLQLFVELKVWTKIFQQMIICMYQLYLPQFFVNSHDSSTILLLYEFRTCMNPQMMKNHISSTLYGNW